MDFQKDLLLVDLETTGLDPEKHEIIQLSALLLDKKTLAEKAVFNSYIKPSRWKNRDKNSMKINRIPFEKVKDAPNLLRTLKNFDQKFNPSSTILSFYGGLLDMDFLRQAYRKNKITWEFDYHYYNLWAVCFTYLALKNKLTNSKRYAGFELEDLMKKYKIKSSSRHDGLEDCRIEAKVFRKILSELGKK